MQLTFDSEKHEYRWSGVAVPSVTQIIATMRDGDGRQLVRVDDCDADYYMSRGTAVHSVIAGQTKAEDYAVEHWHEIHPYIESWRRGVEAFNIRVHQWERREVSRRHRYAGTIDAIGVVGVDGALIDLKTGPPAAWHPLQTAGYAELVSKNGARFAYMPKRCCIYLDSEGGLPKIVWHDNPGDIGAFLGWLNYARWAGVIAT